MKDRFVVNYFMSNLPTKQGCFSFFTFFRVGVHALGIFDPLLLLSYTMIAHIV